MGANLALVALASFNLVCSGTHTTGTLGLSLSDQHQEQFRVIFRVDLDRQRWCSGDCETTAPLASVTDTRITFRYDDAREIRSDSITYVNRESGELFDRDRLGDYVSLRTGTCERAEFTGFPPRRF